MITNIKQSKEMSMKLSLFLKLWLAKLWFEERENFSKSLVGRTPTLGIYKDFLKSHPRHITLFCTYGDEFLFLFSQFIVLLSKIKSLSLLESDESFLEFLALFSNLEKRKSISLSLLESGECFFKISRSLLEHWEKIIHFSFSSRKWRIFFIISLSPLESWDKKITFSLSSRKWRKEIKISLSLLDWTFWASR